MSAVVGAAVGGGLVILNDRLRITREIQTGLASETREAAARLMVAYRTVHRVFKAFRADPTPSVDVDALLQRAAPGIADEIALREEQLFLLPHGEHVREHVRALDAAFEGLVAALQLSEDEYEKARGIFGAAARGFEKDVRMLAAFRQRRRS